MAGTLLLSVQESTVRLLPSSTVLASIPTCRWASDGEVQFRRALASVVAAIDLPFGYTLTIWAAGEIAIDRFGFPSIGNIFAFLVGGIIAYLSIAVVAMPDVSPRSPSTIRRMTLLNVCALVAAIAVSAVSHLISAPLLGFFVAASTGTWAYIVALAAFDWVAGR